MKHIKNKKRIFSSMAAIAGFCTIAYLGFRLAEDERCDGISYEQKMTLLKKEKTNRQMLGNGFGCIGGLESSEECVKFSFDTDGNTNTTEVIAVPEFPKNYDENFGKIGEKKSLKEWDMQFYKWTIKKYPDATCSLRYRKVR